MTYGEIRDRALQLVDQYSVAGQTVALSYNNQADYVKKIPGLINDALELLFTSFRRVRVSVALPTLSRVKFGDAMAYVLPSDFWQLSSAGLATFDEKGNLLRYHKYHMLGENMLVPNADAPRPLIVEYYRHPRLLDVNPSDDTQLDGPIEAQMTIPYYVAAHLVMLDSAFAYSALYNEFETRALRLIDVPQTEVTIAEDHYELEGWGDY